MNHYWPFGGVVGIDIDKIEWFRQIVIDLNSAELPLPPDHVLHNEVDLRAIESCFTFFFGKRDLGLPGYLFQRRFRFVPLSGSTDILRRIRISQSDSSANLIQTEYP